jgi:glycosyltransferase involved in cell wall biosynthesis
MVRFGLVPQLERLPAFAGTACRPCITRTGTIRGDDSEDRRGVVRMRIALCKSMLTGSISGGDALVVNYASHLVTAGHEVSLLLIYPCSRDNPYYVRLQSANIPVVGVATALWRRFIAARRTQLSRLARRSGRLWYAGRRCARWFDSIMGSSDMRACSAHFKEYAPDVVHVVTPDLGAKAIIQAAHAVDIPVLYQELGIPYHPPDYYAEYVEFAAVLSLCSEVAALSPRLLEQCRSTLPYAGSYSVIPIIAPDLPTPVRPSGTTRDRVTIGFAARLEELKGPAVLLDAFAIVAAFVPELYLRVAGDGSHRSGLMSRVEQLGLAHRCEFLNPYTDIKQMSEFMRSIDIFVLPSLTEGTPNTIMEAMACGLPVIGSAVGGVPDMITADTGLLVPPGQPAPLAEAIRQLANDAALRAAMGQAARERYAALFAPGAVLPVLLGTYRKMLARRDAASGAEISWCNGPGQPW